MPVVLGRGRARLCQEGLEFDRRQATQPALMSSSRIDRLDPGHHREPQPLSVRAGVPAEDVLLRRSEEAPDRCIVTGSTDLSHRAGRHRDAERVDETA